MLGLILKTKIFDFASTNLFLQRDLCVDVQ